MLTAMHLFTQRCNGDDESKEILAKLLVGSNLSEMNTTDYRSAAPLLNRSCEDAFRKKR